MVHAKPLLELLELLTNDVDDSLEESYPNYSSYPSYTSYPSYSSYSGLNRYPLSGYPSIPGYSSKPSVISGKKNVFNF